MAPLAKTQLKDDDSKSLPRSRSSYSCSSTSASFTTETETGTTETGYPTTAVRATRSRAASHHVLGQPSLSSLAGLVAASTLARATVDGEVPENGSGSRTKRLENALANLPWAEPPPRISPLASPLASPLFLHSPLPPSPPTATCTDATTATKLYPFLTQDPSSIQGTKRSSARSTWSGYSGTADLATPTVEDHVPDKDVDVYVNVGVAGESVIVNGNDVEKQDKKSITSGFSLNSSTSKSTKSAKSNISTKSSKRSSTITLGYILAKRWEMKKYEETNAASTRKILKGEDAEREDEGDLEMLLGRTVILEKMLKSGKRVSQHSTKSSKNSKSHNKRTYKISRFSVSTRHTRTPSPQFSSSCTTTGDSPIKPHPPFFVPWLNHQTCPTRSSFSNPSGDRCLVSQLPSTRSSLLPYPPSINHTSKEDDRRKHFSTPPLASSTRSSLKQQHRLQLQYSRKLERMKSREDVFTELGSDEEGDNSGPGFGSYGQSHPTPHFSRNSDEATRNGLGISIPKRGRENLSGVGISIREEREGVIVFPEEIDDLLVPHVTPLKKGHGHDRGFQGRKTGPGRMFMTMSEGNTKTKSKADGKGLRKILGCTHSDASSPSLGQGALSEQREDHVDRGFGLGLDFGLDGDVNIGKELFSTATGEWTMRLGRKSRNLKDEDEGEERGREEEREERAAPRPRQSPHLGHRSPNWQARQSISSYFPTLAWDSIVHEETRAYSGNGTPGECVREGVHTGSGVEQGLRRRGIWGRKWVVGVSVGVGVGVIVIITLLSGLLGNKEDVQKD